MSTKLNGSKYCNVSLTILLNISHLFTHSLSVKQFYLTHRYMCQIGLFDPIRCYHAAPEWTWERWQWTGIPHSPVSASDCLSYPGHSLGESYPTAEMQSDSEASVMLELWGMRSTPLFQSLPGRLLLRVVAPDRVLSMDQIELNCVITLNWIVWN